MTATDFIVVKNLFLVTFCKPKQEPVCIDSTGTQLSWRGTLSSRAILSQFQAQLSMRRLSPSQY